MDSHHDTIWMGMTAALMTLGAAAIGVPYGVLESAENPHPSVWSNGWFLALFVVGSLCLAAGLWALASFFFPLPLPRTRRQRELSKRSGLSPEDRRQQLDDRDYPPSDPRRELGENCADMAMKIKVIAELDAEERSVRLPRTVREIQQADPDLDSVAARSSAEEFADRRLVGNYRIGLRDEALRLFDAAHEQGEIIATKRRMADHPEAAELKDLAGMFRAIARRLLGHEVIEPDSETRLEQWARKRLTAAEQIERDCRVGDGETYYLDAMKRWDLENLDQLAEVRGDLLPLYRENQRTGQKEPGPRVTEKDGRRTVEPGEWKRYYGERVAWLRMALQDLDTAT